MSGRVQHVSIEYSSDHAGRLLFIVMIKGRYETICTSGPGGPASTNIVLVKKFIKMKLVQHSDKDSVQCIFEQLSNFGPKLDYQFDDKYSFQSVSLTCLDLFGGPPNKYIHTINTLWKCIYYQIANLILVQCLKVVQKYIGQCLYQM